MAVYRVGAKFRSSKKHVSAVYECDCGKRVVSRVDMPPKSCGCNTAKEITEKDIENISNVILKRIGTPFKVRTGTGMNNSGSTRCAVYECDCGTKIIAEVWKVKTGHTRSCGCWQSKVSSHQLFGNTNGETHGSYHTGTYRSWQHMKSRCNDKSNHSFHNYGGRGIKVCERWLQRENFLSDMGPRPDGMTIDRKEVNGDYEPSNCKWSTTKEQNRNKRTSRILTINGESKHLIEWAEIAVVKYSTIRRRLQSGWSDEEAVFGRRK